MRFLHGGAKKLTCTSVLLPPEATFVAEGVSVFFRPNHVCSAMHQSSFRVMDSIQSILLFALCIHWFLPFLISFSSILAFFHCFLHYFILSFIHSFIHSPTHSFIRLCMHACIHSCMHAFIHSFIDSAFMHACMHSFIHSISINQPVNLSQSVIDSFVPSFVHSFSHLFRISLVERLISKFFQRIRISSNFV